jgi:hypothetical protein
MYKMTTPMPPLLHTILHQNNSAIQLGMVIRVWVPDIRRVPDLTGMDMGTIFYPCSGHSIGYPSDYPQVEKIPVPYPLSTGKKSSPYPLGRVPGGYRIPIPELSSLDKSSCTKSFNGYLVMRNKWSVTWFDM